MRYAEVAVDAPVGHSRTFSYSFPSHLSAVSGQLVWVPFGRRIAQGMVMELTDAPRVEVTRDILQSVDPAPLVSQSQLAVSRWISSHYLCSLFGAIALFLPPGFEAQVRSRLHLSGEEDAAGEMSNAGDSLRELAASPGMDESDFVKLLGRNGDRELRRLVSRGVVRRVVELPVPRLKPRYACRLVPLPSLRGLACAEPRLTSLPDRQAQLLTTVASATEPYPLTLANKEFGAGVANALLQKGLIGQDWTRLDQSPILEARDTEPGPALTLTGDQSEALSQINRALDDPSQQPRSFLLHGVTGSGKTEVYLQAAHRAVANGRQAIYLVPEISLTPQTLERVSNRFPGRVAVVHSRLTQRQQFDQWWKVREGEYDVVVGARSALFAPVPRLGLIVIDEEHEWTYKQEESEPLYHARDAALQYARRLGAVVVMGSATPDVETYRRAQAGQHRLLGLPQRIGSHGAGRNARLASVRVCDMRQELKEGNRGIFSRGLSQDLLECVSQGHQAVLFLNRRGSASIVQCRGCGYVASCRSCSVSMAYHSIDATLKCHRCNRGRRLPGRCPECGGNQIRRMGVGTQRVVEEVEALLPGAQVERWDSDATRSGLSHSETMSRFATGQTQVLVGTQMVAKGLDVPNVTLVGVVLADVGLNMPDFRAAERTFGLLCQVAGRAGRGDFKGKVHIQTYDPEHYAVSAAALQDYGELYQREIRSRRELGNPPFNELVHMVFLDSDATACQRKATGTSRLLRQKAYSEGLTDVELVGPAPGLPSRLRGRYRWHVVVRGRNLHRFLEGVKFPPGTTVDVDPAHVL